MAPGASAVKVATAAPAGCQPRGEVEVSVKAALGPYERNELRVREELETLARNEAPGLGADTVQALDGPGTASSVTRCALRALRRKPNTRLHLPARGGASK
jgi:hypothetical protein